MNKVYENADSNIISNGTKAVMLGYPHSKKEILVATSSGGYDLIINKAKFKKDVNRKDKWSTLSAEGEHIKKRGKTLCWLHFEKPGDVKHLADMLLELSKTYPPHTTISGTIYNENKKNQESKDKPRKKKESKPSSRTFEEDELPF